MTIPRRLPSTRAGSALPANALDWQDTGDEIAETLFDNVTLLLSGVAGTNNVTASCDPPIPEYRTNMSFRVTWANDNSGPVQIDIGGNGNVSVRDADLQQLATGAVKAGRTDELVYDGSYMILRPAALPFVGAEGGLPTGYRAGLGLATNGSDAVNDIDAAAGKIRSEDDSRDIVVAAPLTKRLDAVWAQGTNQGSVLQSGNLTGTVTVSSANANLTGSGSAFLTELIVGDPVQTAGGQCRRVKTISSDIAATVESNWSSNETGVTYKRGGKARNSAHRVFAIRRASDGVADVAVSLRDTPVDLPDGWPQYARIGYQLTDASGDNRPFDQVGDLVRLRTAVRVLTDTALAATKAVVTGAPPGVVALLRLRVGNSVGVPATATLHPTTQASPSGAPHCSVGVVSSHDDTEAVAEVEVPVNAAGEVNLTGAAPGTTADLTIDLLGWRDPRGAGLGGIAAALVFSALDGTTVRVDAAATANVSLATLQNGSVVDGVAVATGQLVLLPLQSAPAQNGAYTVPATGPATRHTALSTYASLCGRVFTVAAGNVNRGAVAQCVSAPGGTIDVTALAFERKSPLDQLAAEPDPFPQFAVKPAMYWNAASLRRLDSYLRYTASTTAATRFAPNGLLEETAAGVPRFNHLIGSGASVGLRVEPSATNIVTFKRDLTNAAWTKTNCTAAQDQTGIAGVANAASKLTASAANATCIQTITSASAARAVSAYVRRITGSGTIEMTVDGGATWSAVTVTSSSWARVKPPVQTVTNPGVGFRIVTSGDAIGVDWVECETSRWTSPKATTAETRTGGSYTFDLPGGVNALEGTIFLRARVHPSAETQVFFNIHDGTNNNRVVMRIASSDKPNMQVVVSAANTINVTDASAVVLDGDEIVWALRYKGSDFLMAMRGRTAIAGSSAVPPGMVSATIGTTAAGGSPAVLDVMELGIWPIGFSDADLEALVALPVANLQLDTDGTLAANSDVKVASQKAGKTYADTKLPASYLDTDGTLAANSDVKVASQKAGKTYADTKLPASYLDTDGTLAANSDVKVASQKAGKTYADTKLPASYLDTDGTLAANSDVKVASQKAVKTYADTKLPASYLDTDGTLAANSDVKVASQKAVKTYALPASYLDTDGTLAANSDVKVASQKAGKTYADTKLPASYLDTDGTLAANSDVKVASQKAGKTYADTKLPASYLDTDGTLAANSDVKVASQKAGKTYADTKLPASYLDTDGTLAANSDVKVASQKAGKTYADTKLPASYLDTDGTLAANSDVKVASQKAGKTYADTKLPASYLDTDGTLAANSDVKVASQKAGKTYVDGGLAAKLNTSQLDTDGTLAANSDAKIASQKATKSYVDNRFPDPFPRVGQKPVYYFTAASLVLPVGMACVRADPLSYVDRNGLVATAAANVPRFGYDPDTFELRGLWCNRRGIAQLWDQTEDVTHANWTKSGLDLTANNATAPDGAVTADLMKPTAVSEIHTVRRDATIGAGSTNTASVWLAAAGYRYVRLRVGDTTGTDYAEFTVDLVTGMVLDSEAITLAGAAGPANTPVAIEYYRATGFWRIGLPVLVNGSATTLRVRLWILDDDLNDTFVGDGIGGVLWWGANLTATPALVSYVAATSAPVTVGAETFTQDITGLLRSAEMCLFLDAYGVCPAGGVSGDTQALVHLDAGAATDRVALRLSSNALLTSNNLPQLVVTVSGANTAALTSGQYLQYADRVVMWARVKQDDFALVARGAGAKPANDLSGNLPAVPTTLRFGGTPTGTVSAWECGIRAFAIFPRGEIKTGTMRALVDTGDVFNPVPSWGRWNLRETHAIERRLKMGRGGILNMLWLGDSWRYRDQYYSNALAVDLVNAYGDAGVGYTSFAFQNSVNAANGNARQDHVTLTAGGAGWTGCYRGIFQGGKSSPDMGAAISSTAGDSWTIEVDTGAVTHALGGAIHDDIKLLYEPTADGAARYRWDDLLGGGYGAWTALDLTVGSGIAAIALTGMPAVQHFKLKIEVVSGSNILHGTQMIDAAGAGVIINQVANGGGQADEYALADATIWLAGVALLGRQHHVSVALGTNDQLEYTAALFRGYLDTIMSRARTQYSVCDLLVVAPPENAAFARPRRIRPYALAAQELAHKWSGALVDLQFVFGDNYNDYKAGSDRDAMEDTLHPTEAWGGPAVYDAHWDMIAVR